MAAIIYKTSDGKRVPSVTTINKIGMERNAISETVQSAMRQAYKTLFREGLTISNAVVQLEKELPELDEIRHLLEFVRSSERGISK